MTQRFRRKRRDHFDAMLDARNVKIEQRFCRSSFFSIVATGGDSLIYYDIYLVLSHDDN